MSVQESRWEAEQRAAREEKANLARHYWSALWEELLSRPGDWHIEADGVGSLHLRVHHNGHLVASGYGNEYDVVLKEALDQLGVKLDG